MLDKDELKITLTEGRDLYERLPESMISPITDSEWWSSTLVCKPDNTIFETIKVKYDVRSLKLTKLFNSSIEIQFNGEEVSPYDFKTDSFSGMQFINDNRHYEIKFDYNKEFELRGISKKLESTWYINFGYSKEDFSLGTDGSVNTLDTSTGYHVKLMSKFIGKALAERYNVLSPTDYQYGCRIFTLVFTNQAEYTSQDKVNLGRIYGIDEYELYTKYFRPEFDKLLDEYSEEFDQIVNKIIEYKKTMGKLAIKDYVNSVVIMGDDKRSKSLNTIIKDCSTKNRDEAELFIVEGKSAEGSIIQARDTRINATLPLRGKVLNVSNMELENALGNREILSMINGIGVGVHPFVDLSKRRFGKVIVTTDADVDGCFTYDTKVHTLKYGPVKIGELKSKFGSDPFYVWSRDKNGRQVPGLAHSPRITKHVDKLYRITLDNGNTIDCTDNHPFMLRSGEFKRADELSIGESLMPFNYKFEKNEKYVINDVGEWVKEFHYSYETSNKCDRLRGHQVHHIDHDHYNNTPTNLVELTKVDHFKLHTNEYNGSDKQKSNLKLKHSNGNYVLTYFGNNGYNGSNEQGQMLKGKHKDGVYTHLYFGNSGYNGSEKNSKVASLRNTKMWKNPGYRDHMTKLAKERMNSPEYIEIASKNCSNQWNDPDTAFRMQASRMVNVIKRCIDKYGEVTKELYNSEKPRSGVPNWNTMLNKLGLANETEVANYAINYNHKINNIEVIQLNEPTPVYDITVEEYHNFALTAGCYVHNSHIALLVLGAFAQFLPEVIEAGMLYIALAPLYEQREKKGSPVYHWDESTLLPKVHTLRFKGLGSCPVYVIKDTVIDPSTRRLIKVSMTDANKALDLLRSKDSRKELMIKNGILVFNTDEKEFEYTIDDQIESIRVSNDGYDYDEVKEMEGLEDGI